jgi:ribosomal protein S18 acetylase RimI-like enzyme
MPKVRRQGLPPALLQHLLDRIQQRQIGADQLGLLAAWLDREPEVPAGRWFKRFPGMTVCGEGEFVKTFLTAEQAPVGDELL